MRAVLSMFGWPDEMAPVADTPAPMIHLVEADDSPPVAASAQRGVRYERGSLVYAIDGPVGTLRQIVIDEEMAEVKALVIRMAAKHESVLMPPDLVDKSVGAALLLNVTKEQFTLGASRSPRLASRMFAGADTKNVARIVPLVFGGDARRSVVSVSGDHVETSDVLAPHAATSQPASARTGWRKLIWWR